jgi:hypothetical protein
LDDGYLGSGLLIKRSLLIHGKNAHTKEILEFCNTREELKQREKDVIGNLWYSDIFCMNLCGGGGGGLGWEFINTNKLNLYGKNGQIGYGGENLIFGRHLPKTEDHRQKLSETLKQKYKNGYIGPFTGKQHSEASKTKIRIANQGKQDGAKNSQFGSRWAWVKLENQKPIKIQLSELQDYLDRGYIRGTKDKKTNNEPVQVSNYALREKELDELSKTVEVYKTTKSLRISAAQLGVSHITVRNKIKRYELLTNTVILNN